MSYLIFVLVSVVLLSIQVILGTNAFKDKVEQIIGDKLYKSFYRMIFIVITILIYFICIKLYIDLDTGVRLISVFEDNPGSVMVLLIGTIQFLALFLVAEALWELELMEFLGIRQILLFFKGKDLTQLKRNRIRGKEFSPKGLYLRHRQPVLFYICLLFLLGGLDNNGPSIKSLIFLLVFIPYYHFNSKYQEKRLSEDYGSSYNNYSTTVRKYWPMWKRFPVADDQPKK